MGERKNFFTKVSGRRDLFRALGEAGKIGATAGLAGIASRLLIDKEDSSQLRHPGIRINPGSYSYLDEELPGFRLRDGIGFGRMELILPYGENDPQQGGFKIFIPSGNLEGDLDYKYEYTRDSALRAFFNLVQIENSDRNLVHIEFEIGIAGDIPRGRGVLDKGINPQYAYSFVALWSKWELTDVSFDHYQSNPHQKNNSV